MSFNLLDIDLMTNNYIKYNELMKYKDANTEMHPDLKHFVSTFPGVSTKPKHSGRYKNKSNWKKSEKKIKTTWIADVKKEKTDEEKLYLQIRGILNKLSSSNFNNLASDLIELDIKSKEHLMALVDIIFKKAITETKFNDIYAKLCYELASYYIDDNNKKV